MEHIYETNDSFPFDKLVLSKPISQNGNFLIRYSIDNYPLYIRPPKASIKQSLIKNTKKSHCDLLFSQENGNFIQWMENLENHTQKTIYENRAQWFESDLEMEDIENSFTSPMKSYKSGKFYIVRTNISQRLGKITLKIYDENEKDITLEDVSENAYVMTILEIQSVKCSAKNFQIEIELKQMLVLNPIDFFERCILKPVNNRIKTNETSQSEDLGNSKSDEILESPSETIDEKDEIITESESSPETIIIPTNSLFQNENAESDLSREDMLNQDLSKNDDEKKDVSENISNQICEIDFNLDELEGVDTVKIKQRDDVYYEMYREARRKAKIAKDLALSSYLEARRIKNKYMLDDISDSDDSDVDYDEINNKTES
jgi:hypothetical protein